MRVCNGGQPMCVGTAESSESVNCQQTSSFEEGKCLTFRRLTSKYSRRTAPLTSKVAFCIFIQQI